MKTEMPHVLVVDDEIHLRKLLTEFLRDDFRVSVAGNGKEAHQLAMELKPDLILMDIKMPELDGYGACALLRKNEETKHIPILFLTAFNNVDYRVKAFDIGADDFISKPFKVEEVISRLKSKYRRSLEYQSLKPNSLQIGNLSLIPESKLVVIDGKELRLTPTEFRLLSALMAQPNRLIKRGELFKTVWRDSKKPDRVIHVQVTLLRKKIEAFGGEIRSIYGEGYLITAKRDQNYSEQNVRGPDLVNF